MLFVVTMSMEQFAASFRGIIAKQLDALCEENGEELKDGGAAMMAYAKMLLWI